MILSRSVDKHGRRRQFLLLLCRFLKTFSCKTTFTFTGSIYGRSFIRFHRDWTKKGRHGQFLFAYWLKIKKNFSSETRRHNELFLCRNNVWEILQTISIFRANYATNMATLGRCCLWFRDCDCARFCIKFPQNKMTGDRHMLIGHWQTLAHNVVSSTPLH